MSFIVLTSRREEEEAEKTWRGSRAGKQVALELQPSTGMGEVQLLMLHAAPVRVVTPVAAETTKNPGWSVADEDFPQ